MGDEESAEIAPETLADPLAGSGEDEGETSAAAAQDDPVPTENSVALARTGERGLARFDPFRRYMAEIGNYPPLTREEEQRLARRYRESGDRQALFRLITANLMLVVQIALSFRRAARNLLDLIQEGNVGLLQAVDRFDPDVGVRLPTYAAYWVRAYMVKFLLDNVRLVRVGTTNARRTLLRNLRREKQRLEEEGFEVGPKLLAERFGVSERDVRDVQDALSSRDVSIDAPVGDEGEGRIADVLPDDSASDVEEQVARRELQERVERTLDRFRSDLGKRDRLILDERILSDDPLTLQEIGDRFGTTREAARQAEARLMTRLREFVKLELGDIGQVRLGPG
jgi:RNA polymerase sigma-32 factor